MAGRALTHLKSPEQQETAIRGEDQSKRSLIIAIFSFPLLPHSACTGSTKPGLGQRGDSGDSSCQIRHTRFARGRQPIVASEVKDFFGGKSRLKKLP
jgi:hypothetical protein